MSPVLLVLAATTPVEAAPADDEIIVIGKRLDAIEVRVGRNAQGRYFCSLSDTSGSARLDRRLCKVSANCVRKGANDGATVKACVEQRKAGLFEAFKREWRKRKS